MRRRLRALRCAIAPTGAARATPTTPHPTPDLPPVHLPPGSLRETASVAEENACAGARDWQLTRVAADGGGGFRSLRVEGYCSAQSVRGGDTLRIMVSAQPAADVTLEIFRMGYYGGSGARLMATLGPHPASPQHTPPRGERGIRACDWPAWGQLEIPTAWRSGVYLGRLATVPAEPTEVASWQSYVIFVVVDERPADVLVQTSDNTWQAYNRWPHSDSLYTHVDGTTGGGLGPEYSVSFDRPYSKEPQFDGVVMDPLSIGSGEFVALEFPLSFWLESHGYQCTYCCNADLLSPKVGRRCKAFISTGHDEYWDLRQFRSVEALRDSGVSLLFLSGNSVCWVSPLSDNNRNLRRAGRYGGASAAHPDAMAASETYGPFPQAGPDEGLLMGGRNCHDPMGGGDWVCAKPEHWLFEGTGMTKGDSIAGLVGWEYHDGPAEIEGLEVVAEGTVFMGGSTPKHYSATLYPVAGTDAFVFNASTIFWCQALSSPPGHVLPWSHFSRPHGPDARVQTMTHNLLRRAQVTRTAANTLGAAAETRFEAAHAYARELVASGKAHGLGLAIAENGKLVSSVGLGVSAPTPGQGLASNQPIEPSSIFEVASITKPFTVLAVVMLLQGRPDITLETPVKDLLPAFAGFPPALRAGAQGVASRDGVTLRHLMTRAPSPPPSLCFIPSRLTQLLSTAQTRLVWRMESPSTAPSDQRWPSTAAPFASCCRCSSRPAPTSRTAAPGSSCSRRSSPCSAASRLPTTCETPSSRPSACIPRRSAWRSAGRGRAR